MHVLLLEDTIDIGEAIRDYLQAMHYSVGRAKTLQESYTLLRKQHFDVAVIDRMLPDGDGLQACRDIKEYKNIPVILATARGQLEDKIQWFGSGADDYIVKPFDLQELELRIRAITQRNKLTSDTITWKHIDIDTGAKEVYKNNKKVQITPKEFLIIATLASSQWQAVSRSTLLEQVRGDDAMRSADDSKLDVYISTIRKKLGKDFIQTEKGFGYKIGI